MSYSAGAARQQVLDTLARAIADLAIALAALGEAYEGLDEFTADRLERELFRPVALAYGRAQRTHSEFGDRHGLGRQSFAPATPGPPSLGVRGFIQVAVEAAGRADETLAVLQGSMLPVEVGDPALRAGLESVREAVGDLSSHSRSLLGRLGR